MIDVWPVVAIGLAFGIGYVVGWKRALREVRRYVEGRRER